MGQFPGKVTGTACLARWLWLLLITPMIGGCVYFSGPLAPLGERLAEPRIEGSWHSDSDSSGKPVITIMPDNDGCYVVRLPSDETFPACLYRRQARLFLDIAVKPEQHTALWLEPDSTTLLVGILRPEWIEQVSHDPLSAIRIEKRRPDETLIHAADKAALESLIDRAFLDNRGWATTQLTRGKNRQN